ncbi:MAG: hypothetical protein ACRBB6_12020 [Neptuniibacter sp.]
MNRKQIAFSIQKSCREHDILLKRSHCYSLIASYFNYPSLAAMDVAGFIVFDSFLLTNEGYKGDVIDGAMKLGFESKGAHVISDCVHRHLGEQGIGHSVYMTDSDDYLRLGFEDLDKDSLSELIRLSKNQCGAQYTLSRIWLHKRPNIRYSYSYERWLDGVHLLDYQMEEAREYSKELRTFIQGILLRLKCDSGAFRSEELSRDDQYYYLMQGLKGGNKNAFEYFSASRYTEQQLKSLVSDVVS